MDSSAPIIEVKLGPVGTEADREAALLADLPRQAREALAASDWRVVRDLEQSGVISGALLSYRAALRAVARGEAFDLPTLEQ